MKIRFHRTRVVQDRHAGTEHETRFEAGQVYDLPDAQAQRWISRGVAQPAPASQPDSTVTGESDTDTDDARPTVLKKRTTKRARS